MQPKHNDDAESYANFLDQQNAARVDLQQQKSTTNNKIDFSAHNQVIQGKRFVKRNMDVWKELS